MLDAREWFARAVGWFQNLECAIALVVILAVAGGALLGVTPYYVQSGSMEPSMHVGSLALVKRGIDPLDLAEGDVVAFEIAGGEIVTHRVVVNDRGSEELTTKGDANEAVDPSPVAYGSVVGRLLVAVPYLGYVVQAIAGAGIQFVLVVAVLNLVLWFAVRAVIELPDSAHGAERI